MKDHYRSQGFVAIAFIPLLFVCLNLMLMNLFLVNVLEKFSKEVAKADKDDSDSKGLNSMRRKVLRLIRAAADKIYAALKLDGMDESSGSSIDHEELEQEIANLRKSEEQLGIHRSKSILTNVFLNRTADETRDTEGDLLPEKCPEFLAHLDDSTHLVDL